MEHSLSWTWHRTCYKSCQSVWYTTEITRTTSQPIFGGASWHKILNLWCIFSSPGPQAHWLITQWDVYSLRLALSCKIRFHTCGSHSAACQPSIRNPVRTLAFLMASGSKSLKYQFCWHTTQNWGSCLLNFLVLLLFLCWIVPQWWHWEDVYGHVTSFHDYQFVYIYDCICRYNIDVYV